MGNLAIFFNLLLPGLGTLLFINKRIQGLVQLILAVINIFIIVVNLGSWVIIGVLIHLGIFAWTLAATISFISEQSTMRTIQQE